MHSISNLEISLMPMEEPAGKPAEDEDTKRFDEQGIGKPGRNAAK